MILAEVTLAIATFGNPQWNRWIYIFQACVLQSPDKNGYLSPPENYDGTWITWHSNGVMWSKAEYANGKLNGSFAVYDWGGSPKASGQYRHGRLDGVIKFWYQKGPKPDDTRCVQCLYRNGKPWEGITVTYEGRWTILQTYRNGTCTGYDRVRICFDPCLQVYKEMHGNKKFSFSDGPYLEYYPTGKVAVRGTYKAGKLHGKWIFWYPDGKKKREGIYVNGLREGRWVEWDRNGCIVEDITYKRDIPIIVRITSSTIEEPETVLDVSSVPVQALQHDQNDKVRREKTPNPIKVGGDSTPQDEKNASQ